MEPVHPRAAAHASWLAGLAAEVPAPGKQTRLNVLGVDLAFALVRDNDEAALRFLEVLPLDERLKFAAVSKRWARLVSAPQLWRTLSFEDAGADRFMDTGDNTEPALAVLERLIKRCGAGLEKLDVRALDAGWSKCPRWPVLKGTRLLHFMEEAGAGRSLTELRLSSRCPLRQCEGDLETLRPRACPVLKHLTCRIYMELDAQTPGRLRRLPADGDKSIILVTGKLSAARTAAHLVADVCKALPRVPSIKEIDFSKGTPRYIKWVYNPKVHARVPSDSVFLVALCKGLAKHCSSITKLNLMGHEFEPADVVALLDLLRVSTGGGGSSGGGCPSLKTIDVRGSGNLAEAQKVQLRAATAARGVELKEGGVR